MAIYQYNFESYGNSLVILCLAVTYLLATCVQIEVYKKYIYTSQTIKVLAASSGQSSFASGLIMPVT